MYDYICSLGEVGEEVKTAIWPHLSKMAVERRSQSRSPLDALGAKALVGDEINVLLAPLRLLGKQVPLCVE